MNSEKRKSGVLSIAGIMAVIATAAFILVPVTATSLIAYIFALFAIAIFCCGNLYLLKNTLSYPWIAAFPMRAWQYLITQLILSAAFILRENIADGIFPIGLFVFLHIAILGVFLISLIMMRGGKEIIESREAVVKEKVFALRSMQADVEAVLINHPEHQEPLRRVLEALKYSDPMSHPSLGFFDEQIQRSIISMTGLQGNGSGRIPEICEGLMRQIAERNSRVKLMK